MTSVKAEYRQISIEWYRFLGIAEIEEWMRATVDPEPLVEAPQNVNIAVKGSGFGNQMVLGVLETNSGL